MSIRALIVDDEPLARERIADLLQSELDIHVVGHCGDGASALAAIRSQAPDVVFLDIQLPAMDGFEVLAQLPRSAVPLIIFVTAYDQFALQAFRAHAVDYLLKPVEDDCFHDALRQMRSRLGHSQDQIAERVAQLVRDMQSTPARSLSFTSGNEVLCFSPGDINWIEAAGNYVCLHTQGGESYLVDETLSKVEARLARHNFVRIHRSRIVSLDHIRKIKPLAYGDYTVVLQGGTRLTLSRSYRDDVLQRVKNLQS